LRTKSLPRCASFGHVVCGPKAGLTRPANAGR
jgi:hypothetical protein